MEVSEEGPGAESVAAVATDANADPQDANKESGGGGVATITDAGVGAESFSCSAIDTENHVGSNGGEEEENDESQPIDDNDSPPDPATPQSPINYAELEDTPYEHNFEPGDHVIRWDMLPILWPIQIHGIVLEVSADKSEVTICDFGITSVKNNEDKKLTESQGDQSEKIVEEENAKFTEAIKDEAIDATNSETSEGETDAPPLIKWPKNKKNKRLHVIKITKWSDLRKWHKINYEGGLLNAGKGGVGKGLKDLGKKTEKLWTSMTKSFAKNDNVAKDKNKAWQTIRYDVDDNGFCLHHEDIQLKRLRDDGDWSVVRKKCPQCIKEDCPAMLGGEGGTNAEDESSVSQSEKGPADEVVPSNESNISSEETSLSSAPERQTSTGDISEPSPDPTSDDAEGSPSNGDTDTDLDKKSDTKNDEPKSLAQMIADANEVEKRSRKKIGPPTPERNPTKSWRQGSFMKSLSSIFTQKNEKDSSASIDSKADDKMSNLENKQEVKTSGKTLEDLPRSDPPVLVLARTRFILEHGEDILPPYHIINSNSECIAVFCKTGRWSTLQASVFLHSTAIGHAKSATALTLGVAATNPWLIPAFATVGLAAVGTPWLFLKVANDKWNEATMTLNEKFWMQAEPEVFVECIDKWYLRS